MTEPNEAPLSLDRQASASVRSSHQSTFTPAASRSPYARCASLKLGPAPSCRMVTGRPCLIASSRARW
eukprot:scaffold9330_cov32-Tisochrysis_lutea.AAC.3